MLGKMLRAWTMAISKTMIMDMDMDIAILMQRTERRCGGLTQAMRSTMLMCHLQGRMWDLLHPFARLLKGKPHRLAALLAPL